MKGTIYILFALCIFGCSERESPQESGKPVVFTSVLPQAGLAKVVAGDLVEIQTLIGEGQSPHSYEPTARQLAALGHANALLTIGVPFEKHLLKKIIPLYPELPIFETQRGIELRTLPHEHDGEQCTHEHGEKDPHIWLTPLNAMIVAGNVCAALQEIDPEHTAAYQKNTDQLQNELQHLHEEIAAVLSPYKGNRFYVFHPSFGYFADAYGLEQIPVELDGKSPSSRQLVGLIEQAKHDGVKVIFVQKQFPADSAKAIADALDGRVVQLDPLAEDSVANLRLIAESITQALKK